MTTGPVTRRRLLRAATAGLSCWFAARAFGANEAGPSPAPEAPPGWSFEGVTGPEHWTELSPDYAPCQFGVEQSPIDLVDASKMSDVDGLTLDYRPITAHLASKGWTVQIEFDSGCAIEIAERRYALEHAYLRRPSEHLLSGRALEMELQLVHRADDGALALIGVFVRQGKKNESLETVLAHVPGKPSEKAPAFAMNPLDFLPLPAGDPQRRPFYRYVGSITMPPCTEGIIWTVFKTPVEASAKQIRDLAELFPRNARPANKLNRNPLFEYDG